MKKNFLKQTIGIPLAANVVGQIPGQAAANAGLGLERYAQGFPAAGSALGGLEVLKAVKGLKKNGRY